MRTPSIPSCSRSNSHALSLHPHPLGITLKPKDFADVFTEDLPSVVTQWAGCYIMMPVLALVLSKLANLSPELTAGTALPVTLVTGAA